MSDEHCFLSPEELQVGHHVHLDLSWMQHPFPTSSFRIRTEEQLLSVRALGLTRVRCSRSLSDGHPVQGDDPTAARSPDATHRDTTEDRASRETLLTQRREALKTCERRLADASRAFKSMTRNVQAQPLHCSATATDIIHTLAAPLLNDTDVALHLIADKVGGETIYQHGLNVSILAMLLARAMKAPPPVVTLVGLGALLHDIGKVDIPERVWRKSDPLTRAEQSWLQQHPALGLEIALKMALPFEAQQVILQHHERVDGSGYPKKLKGTQISLVARIVALANAYDDLCNPVDPAGALTPYEALVTLYKHQRAKFDELALATFVKCMGVYPPGTVVELSDGRWALVVSVNATNALKPTVLVYDPSVPKEAALLIDLQATPEITVRRTLRASELPAAVVHYLEPHGRLTYCFDGTRSAA